MSTHHDPHFVEHFHAHDPTNWWVPNRACAMAMLRSSGFAIVANPEPEVFLCRPVDDVESWRQNELRAVMERSEG